MIGRIRSHLGSQDVLRDRQLLVVGAGAPAFGCVSEPQVVCSSVDWRLSTEKQPKATTAEAGRTRNPGQFDAFSNCLGLRVVVADVLLKF